jgi:hypothetical protein
VTHDREKIWRERYEKELAEKQKKEREAADRKVWDDHYKMVRIRRNTGWDFFEEE